MLCIYILMDLALGLTPRVWRMMPRRYCRLRGIFRGGGGKWTGSLVCMPALRFWRASAGLLMNMDAYSSRADF